MGRTQKAMATVLALCMVWTLLPVTAQADAPVTLLVDPAAVYETAPAREDNARYQTISDAMGKVEDGDVIQLTADITGPGLVVPAGSDFTLSFCGKTYTVNAPADAEHNGFLLSGGSTLIFENGTINGNEPSVRTVLKSSANLTLRNMNIVKTTSYTAESGKTTRGLFVDHGNVGITGNTGISVPADGGVAMDVCFANDTAYPDREVTVNTDGRFTGGIYVTKGNGDTANNNTLLIEKGLFNGAVAKEPDVGTETRLSIAGGSFKAEPAAAYLATGKAVIAGTVYGYPYAVGTPVTRTAVLSLPAGVPAETGRCLTVSGMTLGGEVKPDYAVDAASEVYRDFAGQFRANGTFRRGCLFGVANIRFNNIIDSETAFYRIEQTNAALGAAYPEAFADGKKNKVYTGAELQNGLNFLVAYGGEDLAFKIEKVIGEDGAFTAAAQTFTVANNVTFEFDRVSVVVAKPQVTPLPADPPLDDALRMAAFSVDTNAAGIEAIAEVAGMAAAEIDNHEIEEAAERLGDISTDKAVSVVVRAGLLIEPIGYDVAKNELTLDIKAIYDRLGTINPTAMVLDEDGKNAVMLTEDPLPLAIVGSMEITFKIPEAMAKNGDAVREAMTVKSITDEGVRYDRGRISEEEDGSYRITFATESLGRFILMEDTRTATVGFEGLEVKTLTAEDVNMPLPAGPALADSTFDGWTFIDKRGEMLKNGAGEPFVAKTLTDDLLNELTDPERFEGVITATPKYTRIVTPRPKPKVTIGFMNFTLKDASAYRGYSDVKNGFWYSDDGEAVIRNATLLGIVQGDGEAGTFRPDDRLKVSEAVKIACEIHSIYYNDGQRFEEADPWYAPYLVYAVRNGIIGSGDFGDVDAECTREQAALIFAGALPAAAFQRISDRTPPDVGAEDAYRDEILLLYGAGVLNGNDALGTFGAKGAFTRAQAAALVTRICIPANRTAWVAPQM